MRARALSRDPAPDLAALFLLQDISLHLASDDDMGVKPKTTFTGPSLVVSCRRRRREHPIPIPGPFLLHFLLRRSLTLTLSPSRPADAGGCARPRKPVLEASRPAVHVSLYRLFCVLQSSLPSRLAVSRHLHQQRLPSHVFSTASTSTEASHTSFLPSLLRPPELATELSSCLTAPASTEALIRLFYRLFCIPQNSLPSCLAVSRHLHRQRLSHVSSTVSSVSSRTRHRAV